MTPSLRPTEFYTQLRPLKFPTVSIPPYPLILESRHRIVSVIACSLTRTEIVKDWEWLLTNVADTLRTFDSDEDITDYVMCKIESVIAIRVDVHDVEGEFRFLIVRGYYPFVMALV